MALRLDNAKCVAHMPTAAATKNKSFEPRFKIDHAASQMPETRQPERLAPRATSNRNGGRDHLGILGEIKSVHPGEIIGIGTLPFLAAGEGRLSETVSVRLMRRRCRRAPIRPQASADAPRPIPTNASVRRKDVLVNLP